MDDWPDITTQQIALTVSIAVVGAAVGSLFSGTISDKVGRKPVILFADFLFTGGALIMAYSPTIGYLILGRFVVGIGVGAASQIVPLYLSEVAPVEIRGTLVSFSVMISTFAMFIAGCLAYALKPDWRWMLGLAGIPSSL